MKSAVESVLSVPPNVFQFLIGSMKSYLPARNKARELQVSIPYRLNEMVSEDTL